MSTENTYTIEIKDKYLLTVCEAAQYFGIGEKKLRDMSSYTEGLFLQNGTKLLINRHKMEDYLDTCTTV